MPAWALSDSDTIPPVVSYPLQVLPHVRDLMPCPASDDRADSRQLRASAPFGERDKIEAAWEILGGKPCVRGTRLSVEFVLELAASGATREQILASYPQLTPEGLAAAFRYAADVAQR